MLPYLTKILGSLALLLGANLWAAPLATSSSELKDQLIAFDYIVKVPALKEADLPLQIMVPLPPSNPQQVVLSREIIASPTSGTLFKSRIAKEPKFGNEFWAVTIEEATKEEQEISFRYQILRHPHRSGDWSAQQKADYEKGERDSLQLYLKADKRVPIDGELVTKLRKEIPKTAQKPTEKAKAIFDYVVDNMEYKKVGTGWGQGDTYWACSQKYGNCTDFHALVTSMARAEGIPTQFGIGFPIPSDKTEGEISGYHCWLELYLPKLGWTPLDASEAKKHPEQRALLFGHHPADRILFSLGRDLVLPGMQTPALNYFIYPHVERKNEVVKDLVSTKFRFRILPLTSLL